MSEKREQLILIVDDNPNNLQVLGSILSTRGYKIALAKSGTEALSFVENKSPDLIFLDIMMPDLNGFEVCERLKASERSRMIPVIFVSALSNTQHKLKAFSIGGVDYITKPFNVAEVVERARVHLDLKSMREALMDTNQQLRQQINERQKLEGELRKAKEKAEATTKTKSDFLASMSHEIRTPMNGIIATASLLKNTDLNDTQKDYVDIIDYSANNLLTIINDILDISKIEAGQITLEHIDFNLHNVINETLKLLKPKAREKEIRFEAHIDESVPLYAKGDPIRLKQIVINLANNAIKFTSEGSVKIEVETIEKADSYRKYLFKVVDTGIGIPKAAHDKLFKEYLQAEISTSRKFGGTGLGLSISKKLVELMQGEIGFESEEGKGSTFWFTARLAIGKEPPYDLSDPEAIGNGENHKLRILIAEDNLMNQKVVIATLKNLGHKLEVADNGRIALDMHKKTPYDVILMDVQMPVMDGFESTALIRKWEQQNGNTNKVRIIAMTASAMKEDREKCLEAGMDEYISKPFKALELARILDELPA